MSSSGAVLKSADAFRTISEVADELDLPQHVLRFWETRFAQIKPLKRGGGRRFYRPEDVELLNAIRRLLYGEGYTIRGVQRILKEQGPRAVAALAQKGGVQPASGVAASPPRQDMDEGWFPGGPVGESEAPALRDLNHDISFPPAHGEDATQPGSNLGGVDQMPWHPVESVPLSSPRPGFPTEDGLGGLRAILAELEECKRILLAAQS